MRGSVPTRSGPRQPAIRLVDAHGQSIGAWSQAGWQTAGVTRTAAPRVASTTLVSVVALAGCTSGQEGAKSDPEETAAAEAATNFVTAWTQGDDAAMRGTTDAPAQAARTINAAEDALAITETRIELAEDPACGGDRCTAGLRVTHYLAGAGEWRYATTLRLRRKAGDRWLVQWTPQTFHPALDAKAELRRSRDLPPRASIVDRDGRPLTEQRLVVRIGVVPAKVKPKTYDQLRTLLDIDAAALRARVRAAEPDWFVDVITLRRSDYEPLRKQLLDVPGISLDPGRMSLAPTSSWGRAVLGTVAPATAETLKAAGPTAVATDLIGSSGLQAAYQRQLAGTPAVRIELVDTRSGKALKTLHHVKAVPGTPLGTTLDYGAQDAAERAIAEQTKATALVAVQASTGEVLAVANGPGVTSYNTAFVGQYPPGSTFKVVSAATLLDAGVIDGVNERVECPDTVTVGGKSFRNYEGALLPSGGTFVQAFAESCNTTVVQYADDIANAALPDMARRFGIGADWDLGLDAYNGQVPAPASLVERAADMIGQGKVLASPLGMALVAAAVDSGQPMTPTLIPEDKPGGPAADALPKRLVRDLRTLMRAVVTQGTGTVVDLPGLPVFAKTGTAEYGSAPIRTHAWMVGFRGDLAFAVIVVNGQSGAHDAGPVVASFLRAVPPSAY